MDLNESGTLPNIIMIKLTLWSNSAQQSRNFSRSNSLIMAFTFLLICSNPSKMMAMNKSRNISGTNKLKVMKNTMPETGEPQELVL